MVLASSNVGDLILDPFGGSGTTGSTALETGRRFLLSDESDDAIETMKRRFHGQDVDFSE